MKQFFVDIETNRSLDEKKGKIIQLSGYIVINGIVIEKFDFKSNIYKHLIRLLDKHVNKYDVNDKFDFIAYNATFDLKFIRELFIKSNNEFFGSYFYSTPICVLNMSRIYLRNNKNKPENFKLSTVASFFKIPVNKNKLHDGLYDITLTLKLYRILDKKLN